MTLSLELSNFLCGYIYMDKGMKPISWFTVTLYFEVNYAISIDVYSLVNKFYSVIIFSLLINAVILLLYCLVLILHLNIHDLSLRHYFLLLKHYLELYITDTALKVSQSLYCFTVSVSHGVENYFPRLWGTGISDAIFTPQPLRAVGVLFSPMVSGWAGGPREKVCPGCISETIRCREVDTW